MIDTIKLNRAQALHVLATFRYVDELLASIQRVARADLSPFAAERLDVTVEEARSLDASVAAVRSRMLAALDRLGVPRPEPKISARWSVHMTYRFMETSLSELDAAHLRAYGPLDEAASRTVERLSADLAAVARAGPAGLKTG